MDDAGPARVYASTPIRRSRTSAARSGSTLEYDSDTLPLLDHYLRTRAGDRRRQAPRSSS